LYVPLYWLLFIARTRTYIFFCDKTRVQMFSAYVYIISNYLDTHC